MPSRDDDPLGEELPVPAPTEVPESDLRELVVDARVTEERARGFLGLWGDVYARQFLSAEQVETLSDLEFALQNVGSTLTHWSDSRVEDEVRRQRLRARPPCIEIQSETVLLGHESRLVYISSESAMHGAVDAPPP